MNADCLKILKSFFMGITLLVLATAVPCFSQIPATQAVAIPASTGTLSIPSPAPEPPEKLFELAGAAYENGEYNTAAQLYEKLTETGFAPGIVYFNLGNSYYRSGNLGPAILNYRRAQKLMPRDREIFENLSFTRSLVIDETPDVQSTVMDRPLLKLLERFSLNEITLATSAAYLLCMLLLCAAIYTSSPAMKKFFKRFALLFAACALLAGAGLGMRIYDEKRTPAAVILADRFEVRAGPDESYSTVFILHEGAEVSVIRERDDWWNISFPAAGKGWIKKSAIEKVEEF